MKTKFKEFVKKIKNWLFGLAKWVKINCLELFMAFLSIILLISICLSCNSNKKIASAQTLYSEDKVFVTQNFVVSSSSNEDLLFLPFFLGYSNHISSIYIPSSVDYATGNFNYYSLPLTRLGVQTYWSTTDFDFIVQGVNRRNYWYAVRYNDVAKSYVYFSAPNYNRNDNNIVGYIFDNCVRYDIKVESSGIIIGNSNIDSSSIVYRFYNNSNTEFCFLKLNHTKVLSNYGNSLVTCSPLFLSSNTNRVAVAEELLQNSYTLGYNKGYTDAYLNAYDIGFNDGVEYSADDVNFQPFSAIIRAVTSFVNMPILGSVTIGSLISIGFGLVLFGFAIKIFLGG